MTPDGSLREIVMGKSRGPFLISGLRGLIASFFLVLTAAGCDFGDKPLPEQGPDTVVEKFYEYISESRIRGGTLLIREAFKLTNGEQSHYGQAKFLEVINRYPSGFKAAITKTDILERRAEVTIEYMMASSFGGTYKVSSVILLNVDEETNTWKIDFRGDTDDQDKDKIAKEYVETKSDLVTAKDSEK